MSRKLPPKQLVCGFCKSTFYHKRQRQFCSRRCSSLRLNGPIFKKNGQPWNKGTKGICKPNSGSFTSEKMIGEKHFAWKGDKVGYMALHRWINSRLGHPSQCENCGTGDAPRFEWANISGEYKRDLSDWARLCKRCHCWIDNIGRNKGKGIRADKWAIN